MKMKIEEIISKAIEERIVEELKPLVEANRKVEDNLSDYLNTKDIDPTYLDSLQRLYKEAQSTLYKSRNFAEKILGKKIYIYTTGDIEIKEEK